MRNKMAGINALNGLFKSGLLNLSQMRPIDVAERKELPWVPFDLKNERIHLVRGRQDDDKRRGC